MEQIVTSINGLFTAYGARAASTIIFTVVAVNLIKKPIVSFFVKKAEAKGYAKDVVTRYITILPVIVAFVFNFIFELFTVKFKIGELSISDLGTKAVFYGGLSIALYEGIKKQLIAYAEKRNAAALNAKEIDKDDESVVFESTSDVEETQALDDSLDTAPKDEPVILPEYESDL